MSLQTLQDQIANALNIQATDNPTQGEALRRQLASSLATAIDAYVQDQIGQRLQLLPTAIVCPAPAGVPVPSAGFPALTRLR
ncbi:hypothetical protein EBU95_07980 [bacterium]|nr:hypothetical protein [bacterium]